MRTLSLLTTLILTAVAVAGPPSTSTKPTVPVKPTSPWYQPPPPTEIFYRNGDLKAKASAAKYTFVALWDAGIPEGTKVPLEFANAAVEQQASQLLNWRVWIRGYKKSNGQVVVTVIGPNR